MERDARRALLDAVSEEVRDNVDALRFTEASASRVANATAFHPDAAKKEASSTDGEDAEDADSAESAENATRSPSATTNASLSAPPLFVANLPEGNTSGTGRKPRTTARGDACADSSGRGSTRTCGDCDCFDTSTTFIYETLRRITTNAVRTETLPAELSLSVNIKDFGGGGGGMAPVVTRYSVASSGTSTPSQSA